MFWLGTRSWAYSNDSFVKAASQIQSAIPSLCSSKCIHPIPVPTAQYNQGYLFMSCRSSSSSRRSIIFTHIILHSSFRWRIPCSCSSNMLVIVVQQSFLQPLCRNSSRYFLISSSPEHLQAPGIEFSEAIFDLVRQVSQLFIENLHVSLHLKNLLHVVQLHNKSNRFGESCDHFILVDLLHRLQVIEGDGLS